MEPGRGLRVLEGSTLALWASVVAQCDRIEASGYYLPPPSPSHHARARLLQNLFNGHSEFNDDIGDWDVSKVTNFQVR